ncbi:MAG: HEAT repeat domain-containing protein [Cyclobacteriaceae bacterium]|nr:HEAT repeat domain-containing protein [Cyclobacteriaceae bacterium]
MNERLTKLLGVEPNETGPVSLLLALSFLMGLFLATVAVAAQTFFLSDPTISEKTDLPVALVIGGGFGFIATGLFNILQGRIPFRYLAVFFLLLIIASTAVLEFGDNYPEIISPRNLYYVGFALILPFTFVTNLVFWGSFNRIFTLRQQKLVVGSVDIGMDIAQIIAFFTIPIMLQFGLETKSLFTIGLFSIVGFLVLFIVLSNRYLSVAAKTPQAGMLNEKEHKKLNLFRLLRFRYFALLSAFIIVSFAALRFIDYSFLNITNTMFSDNIEGLPKFLSYFEATVVITGFMFGLFVTDRIQQEYGLRVSLIINPLLLIIFTGAALGLGFFFGYEGGTESVVFFFIAIAMSKLFVNSLRDALDTPVFKYYYVPIEKSIKLDAQTKIEGVVTAAATMVAGGLIVLINMFDFFNLLSVTLFTLPLLGLWYLITNRMYSGYRDTLQGSLQKNRESVQGHVVREFTLNSVLEKEVNSTAEEKVIYGLKLMEKLEPALFEASVLKLASSDLRKVKKFAEDKIEELGLNLEGTDTEITGLARQAAGAAEDSDLMSISPEKLLKLGKSVKQSDRMLAAKLLRKMTTQKTIFILLELLRDADPKVRNEAILTARKVKRPESWPVLIDMLSSPMYSNQSTAALKESGTAALQVLDTAFYKSGQTDQVMLKIVQIIGNIGGEEAWQLLWKKSDYPDKRIVKQIFYSLRFTNYNAKGRERRQVMDLLDTEVGKTLWNLNAQEELPDEQHFSFLKQALREELRDNYDQISLLMSILYDPQSVQLVRENVETGTADGIAYAMELLDLFVDQEVKPRLFPIFDDLSPKEKMNRLQVYFPRETYNPVQVVNYILNRDFNLNNRWTKMCAVYASAFIPEFRVSRGLIGQMFNPDRLLQETAAWVIFNKDKAQYKVIADRLPLRDKKFLDTAIESNQLLDGLEDGFFLGIEMVMFIKALPVFEGIPGSILSDLADKIIPVDLRPQDKILFTNPDENRPILICAVGTVKLREGSNEVSVMKKGDVFGDLFQEGPSVKITEVEAIERTVVFRINLPDFYFVMAKHHDLVQGLVRNVTTKSGKVTV